jgi:hypothetical protein
VRGVFLGIAARSSSWHGRTDFVRARRQGRRSADPDYAPGRHATSPSGL